jgi:hypothetical protein
MQFCYSLQQSEFPKGLNCVCRERPPSSGAKTSSGDLYDTRSLGVMKRSAASIARAGDIQRRDSTAPPPTEEESLLTSEDEDSPAESSESLLLGGDEDGEEEEDDPQYNNVCEYCRCKLSEDVSIYVYSKRDDVNADMAACTAPKPQLCQAITVSIPSSRQFLCGFS